MRNFGWFTFNDVYDLALLLYSGTFVEIGAWVGESTAYMAKRVTTQTFYTVDTWMGSQGRDALSDKVHDEYLAEHGGDIYQVFMANMAHLGLTDKVTPLRMKSTEAAQLFQDKSIDFIYIDGAHDTVSVDEDITHWAPKVRSGGLLAGHDYNWPTVRQVVDSYFKPTMLGCRDITSWLVKM